MGETGYNIPKQYKTNIKVPIATLLQNLDNAKCYKVFEAAIDNITWKYHIVDKKGITNVSELIKERGFSVFEVSLRKKIAPDLLTDIFSQFLQRPLVLVYLYGEELSMGAYIPMGKGTSGRKCTTDFYEYNPNKMIEILDFSTDVNKNTDQIHKRIYGTIKHKKRTIMLDNAYRTLFEDSNNNNFHRYGLGNMDKIKRDAEFIREQLRL